MTRTSLNKFCTLLLPLLGLLTATNSVQATNIGLPLTPPGAPYIWGGDTFQLNSSQYSNGRVFGSEAVGTRAEVSTIAAQSTRITSNPMWTGSTAYVMGTDDSNHNDPNADGYVTRNLSNPDPSNVLYLPNLYYGLTVKYPIVSTQAAVRVGASGTADLGMMDDPSEFSSGQQAFSSMGEVWMSLDNTGAWDLWLRDQSDTEQSLATGKIGTGATANQTFVATDWQALFVAWDVRTNTLTAEINGTPVFSAVPMTPTLNPYYPVGTVPAFGAFGFQLSGSANLDNFSAVPEPSALILAGIGALGLALLARRRQTLASE